MNAKPVFVLALVATLMGGAFVYNSHVRKADIARVDPNGELTHSTTNATTETGAPAAKGAATDWQSGLERATRIENELFQKPDSARVGEIMLPACTCYQDTVDRLNSLKAKKQHVAGPNIVLKNTTLLSQPLDNRVRIFTDPTSAGFGIADSSGKIVEAAPRKNPKGFIYVMDKGSDGVWRIADRYLVGSK